MLDQNHRQKLINIWWEDSYKPVNRLPTKEQLTDSVSDWKFSEKLLHLRHTKSTNPILWSEGEQQNSTNKSVSPTSILLTIRTISAVLFM